MSTLPKTITLIRHGETAWALSGQHTGRHDIALTEHGMEQAVALELRLKKEKFDAVYASPLKRALETSKIAGFSAKLDPALMEWDYGDYEGLTRKEIEEKNPKWDLFTQGVPGGESPEDVRRRAEKFLNQLPSGNIAIFAHSHLLRVLTTCWLHMPTSEARNFFLSTASISILGFEHKAPVIILWNDISHL
jgi:broad specificity phosphatase PhoE